MLDKKIFQEEMEMLLILFPNWNIDVTDSSTMKRWYERFENMDNERFSHMVSSYVEQERFQPTVAGLKEHDTLPRKSVTQRKHEEMLKEHGLL